MRGRGGLFISLSASDHGDSHDHHEPDHPNTAVEILLAEFNEGLRVEGKTHFEILHRCPEPHRRELLSLMNVAALAFRALAPLRASHSEHHDAHLRVAV